MKKRISLVVMCGILSISLLMMSGCTTNEVSKSSGSVESGNSVVAVFNGKNVTRDEVSGLIDAEKESISTYLYTLSRQEFFKDVVVTEQDIDNSITMIKAQVGEESWPMYLAYYGGGSEEGLRKQMEDSLRMEKYINAKMDKIEISDDMLKEEYNKDPDSYNIVVMNTIFMGDETAYNKGVEMMNSGKSLKEISEALELPISDKDEHAFFKSESLKWLKDLNTCKIGDLNATTSDSGSFIIGEIKELNVGVENQKVRDEMIKNLQYAQAMDETQNEYNEFLKGLKAQILGEDFLMYEEPPVDSSTDETDSTTDENMTDTSSSENNQ